MKYLIVLLIVLAAVWTIWSGHWDDPFLLSLGGLSVLLTLWICVRMRLVDAESVPIQLLPGLIPYLIYLTREIVVSNVAVARIILSPRMDLRRSLYHLEAHQQSELGNVILANSITLTPGTVSVHMTGNQIQVHALSFEGVQEDLSGEMERRVAKLEGN